MSGGVVDWGMVWVARGLVPGVSAVNKVGRNPDVDTNSTPEDLWGGDGLYAGFPVSTAEPVEALSSNALDAAAGTGLRTVVIQGLDQDWNEASETLTLNGLTPVQSANIYRRVHTMRGMLAGSSGSNVGVVTVRHATTEANVFLAMRPGTNQTNCSAYTVPSGSTAFLMYGFGSLRGSANASAECSYAIRTFGGVTRLRRPFTLSAAFEHQDVLSVPVSFPEKTDIIIRCLSASANNLDLSSGYDLLLIRN